MMRKMVGRTFYIEERLLDKLQKLASAIDVELPKDPSRYEWAVGNHSRASISMIVNAAIDSLLEGHADLLGRE